jgi:type II secretory pathway component PulM
LAVVAALTLALTRPAFAQQAGDDLRALRQEIEALKQGQAAIQKDVQEIKTLLRARPAAAPAEPRDVVLSVGDAPVKGERTAKLTLFDFSDYQ